MAHEIDSKALHLGIAMNNFINAEISDYWETRYPEDFQIREIFYRAKTNSDGSKILSEDLDKAKLYRAISFLQQPESNGYRSAKLLSLADEIELVLNAK